MTDRLADILDGAAPFVAARRKQTGGFSATPTLPATIEDTYHALHILDLARQCGAAGGQANGPGTEDNLKFYLQSCRRHMPAGTRTTFHLLRCCRMAGLELDPDRVGEVVMDRMEASTSLEDWYYLARISAEVLGDRSPMIPGGRNLSVVLQQDWRSVDEAWRHIYLSLHFGRPLPRGKAELIAWYRACQNGDGGFGFYRGTTSFIENCHYCLRALAALGGEPARPDKARHFLIVCRTGSGGFGRGLRAAPFLDATWHGVAALAILGRESVPPGTNKEICIRKGGT